MSISKVFYTLMRDKSVVFQEAEFKDDHVIFRGRLKSSAKKCACCQSSNIWIKETKERTFRILNLGQLRTYLKIDAFKIHCQKCDSVH